LTNQNTVVNINVLTNDSDIDGGAALQVMSVTPPAHGTATINAGNTVTYTPVIGFSGQDSFSYTVSDGEGGEHSATVSVTVKAAPTTFVLTVNSADMYGKATSGLYTAIRAGSTTVKTGFTTLAYTGSAGATFSVTVSDYGSSFFDHWENGSTARARTVTLNADTAITAHFRVPTVVISPASGTGGAQVGVTGTYFSPNSLITVTYDGQVMATRTTSSSGAFSASFAAPVLGTGWHTVQAVDGKGWKASAKFEDTTPPPDHPLKATILPKTGVYLALYMYPAGGGAAEWQKVIDAKKAHPSVPIVVTFNPNSGPGNAKDPTIASWVSKLKQEGVVMIGYTYDDYGTRSLAALKADADKYRNWYGADGLFIDEFTNRAGFENHYRDVTAYAKSIGMKMTMGNPGTDVPKTYVGTVDVLNITEGRGYMPISWLQY
ncbi:MAG: spherulation-specific family 4 protein, partial [Nitrososphaera sp.]